MTDEVEDGLVPTRRIRSVGDLVAAITASDRRRPLWFRGQRDARWDVAPSLWRRDPRRGRYTVDDERNFTHRFRTRAAIRYPGSPDYDDHAGWLSLMQHYGLPSRLLDWSRSPLVAAFFALEAYLTWDEPTEEPTDAAIWALSPHVLNWHYRTRRVTPAISSEMCADLVSAAFRDQDDAEIAQHPTRPGHGVMAVMASETDLRMFVQQGCFTVHSDDSAPLNVLGDAGIFLERLMIPSGAVRQMAAEIEACGFRQGDIYPDLTNLASELRQTYAPGSVHGVKG